ncbi:MAG: recombinase family protein [Paracoccaceae bacterium]
MRLCRERAESEGHEVVECYSDHAISGGDLRNRPGMLSLLDDARAGAFDLLISESLDRLSRDQEDIAAIFKRLSYADIAIVTLGEGAISELHIGLKGTMNSIFLKDLAAKTRRGQRGRVEAGKIPGGNSYGYRIIRELTEGGGVTTGERALHESEASIVRRIFEEYADGLPPRRIAARLNAEGVPGPRGGPWNASTINGSRQRRNGILHNGLYLGRITYNRQRFVKDPETGKRVSRPNPEASWNRAEVPHLRIIDDALWDRVQGIKSRYSSQAGNKRQTKKRLLSGLVRCGACGGSMTIVNRERYSCSARRERGTCDNPASVGAAELETRVLAGLRSILLGREDLIEEFARAYKTELDRLRRTGADRARDSERELHKVTRSIERCLTFITEGDGDPGSVAGMLRDLETRKRALETEQARIREDRFVEIHPNVAELYARKVSELQGLLADERSREEAVVVVRGLIDRIEVSVGPKRGVTGVILVGVLATALDFASAKTKTAAQGGGGRDLMVAGAGFEPATFRL